MFGLTDTTHLDSVVRCSFRRGAPAGSEEPLLQAVGRFRSRAGFTLVEFVLVMILAGMLALTIGVKFSTLGSSTNVKTAIAQVANDLRFLQSRTMATGATTTLGSDNTAWFPAGGTTYQLGQSPTGKRIRSLPDGVTVNGGLTVTFNSLGEYAAYTDAVIRFYSRSLTGSIKIHAVTGYVEAY